LSQDHLELFFGLIRRRGGLNDNPTSQQFEGAYKRLLLHSDLVHSPSANCTQQDDTNCLKLASNKNDNECNWIPNILDVEDFDYNYEYDLIIKALSTYKRDVSYYISGFIVRSMNKKFQCKKCKELLRDMNPSNEFKEESLIALKDRGGLVYASQDVSELCMLAEQVFDHFMNEEKTMIDSNCNVLQNLLAATMRNNLESRFSNHGMFTDGVFQEEFAHHPKLMTEMIITKYFNIRLFHYGKLKRNEIRRNSKRTANLKATHNAGN
jgi:hypothetical protein